MSPERVRSARLESGLSLAELAGDSVSRALIHQVEHGKARPSRSTLELIAAKTGKPIQYFLEHGPATELEHALWQAHWAAEKALRNGTLRSKQRAAVQMVASVLRQSIHLVETIQERNGRRSEPHS